MRISIESIPHKDHSIFAEAAMWAYSHDRLNLGERIPKRRCENDARSLNPCPAKVSLESRGSIITPSGRTPNRLVSKERPAVGRWRGSGRVGCGSEHRQCAGWGV